MVKILVGNIPYSCTPDDVKAFCEPFGPICSVYIPACLDTGRPKGIAIVQFRNGDDARKALRELNHTYLLGRKVYLNIAEEDRLPGDPIEEHSPTKESRTRGLPIIKRERQEETWEARERYGRPPGGDPRYYDNPHYDPLPFHDDFRGRRPPPRGVPLDDRFGDPYFDRRDDFRRNFDPGFGAYGPPFDRPPPGPYGPPGFAYPRYPEDDRFIPPPPRRDDFYAPYPPPYPPAPFPPGPNAPPLPPPPPESPDSLQGGAPPPGPIEHSKGLPPDGGAMGGPGYPPPPGYGPSSGYQPTFRQDYNYPQPPGYAYPPPQPVH